MEKINTMVFDPKCYDNEISEMWLDISDLLETLTTNDYNCVVRREEQFIIVEFESGNLELGVMRPFWVYEDEINTIINEYRKEYESE